MHRSNIEGVAWAIMWGFADTLAQFDSRDCSSLKRVTAEYAAMAESARQAARDCKDRIQAILTETRLQGFSTTAIAWSMLGAILNIQGQILRAQLPARHANRQAEKLRATLIMALNRARRTTIN